MSKSSRAREKFEKISQRKSNAYLTNPKGSYIVKPKDQPVNKSIESISTKFRNKLISNATSSELLFKKFLDNNNISYSFQKVIFVSVDCKQKFYIADFYFKKYNLIVELDGGYHYTNEQGLKDDERTINLRRSEYFILRFDNKRSLDSKSMYDDILSFIKCKFKNI